MISQEQKYMKVAHSFVIDAQKNLSQNDQNDYQSRVQSAPVLIHDTGLMQTLAFYISKEEKSLERLAKHLLCWLNVDCEEHWQSKNSDSTWNLFSNLIDQSSDKLLMNTEKTLKLLQWLKRFSESQLKKEE